MEKWENINTMYQQVDRSTFLVVHSASKRPTVLQSFHFKGNTPTTPLERLERLEPGNHPSRVFAWFSRFLWGRIATQEYGQVLDIFHHSAIYCLG